MTKSEIASFPTIPMTVVHWGFGKTFALGTAIEVGDVAFVDPKTKAVGGVVRTRGKGCKASMYMMSNIAHANGWDAHRIIAG